MKTKHLDFLNAEVGGLILGTMPLFSGEAESHFEHLDMALANGVNVLDSALGYGDSELTIGKWMQARGNRADVILITKGGHPNPFRKRVTPFDIAADLHDSLARLQTDYIDIYLLHRDDPDVPVGVIAEALNEHFVAGRIRSYGGSNWTAARIAELNAYAEAHGLEPFRVSSPSFSLAEQAREPWAPGTVDISGAGGASDRDWYVSTGLPVFAYSSLARGFFSGRVTRERFEKEQGHFLSPEVLFSGKATRDQLTGHGETIDPICAAAYCTPENFGRQERATEVAGRHGCTLPQIALAYTTSKGMNLWPICGVANEQELQSSIEALSIELSAEEITYIEG